MPIQPSSGCKNVLQKCRNLPQINYWISIKLIVKGHETQNDNGKKTFDFIHDDKVETRFSFSSEKYV